MRLRGRRQTLVRSGWLSADTNPPYPLALVLDETQVSHLESYTSQADIALSGEGLLRTSLRRMEGLVESHAESGLLLGPDT